VLSPDPRFVLLTAYAVKASAITLHNAMAEMTTGLPGSIAAGEVVLKDSSAGRLLSMAIFARWSSTAS
jgi:23S rRNA (cytosine1962-C5)-methyltransferase